MEGGGIDEQVLKDFIATAQESNYDYDLVMPKFPELAGYDLQILKDYIATAEENSYDYAAVNAKFPELFEVKKKDEPTEFISEDGFSEPSEATPSVGVIESNQQLSDEDRAAIGGIDLAPEDPRVAEQNRLLEQDYEQRYSPEAQAKFAARELEDAATIDRETKKSDAEALQLDIDRAAAVSLPEVEDVLAQVNPALIDLEEEEVVEKMRSLFKGRGFTFEEIGLGTDRMRVRTTDGLYSLDIDLDNFTNSADVAESAALQVFLRKHFNPTLLPESQDEITKALRAQQMRGTQELWNEDGSASTVRFMSYEEDGVHKVAPTLFPKSTTQPSSPRAEDWLQLDMGAAIEEAERRGEVISFDSQEEAEAFAEGSWKTMNLVDLEAQQFFNERGRDYISDRNAYDNYADSQEARLFLEEQIEIQQDNRWDDAGQFDDLTPEEQAAYGKYFRKDGSLRSDATDIVKALDEGEGNLWDIVNNDDYRRAQEDLDVHLEGIHRKTAQEAANLNYEAKYIEQGLEAQSLEEFGVNLEQLTTYQPKTEQERVRIEEMTEVQLRVQTKKQTAALKYETALTYYDAKANKEASQEYLDNLEGWAVATNDGYKNGRAAQQLLYLSMGIYDVEDEAQLELAATRMTDYMNSVDGRQSRALSRYNSAEDGWNREVRGALSRDPIETMMTWAGASFSQILPYGAKIIPSFAAAGASAGALAGLSGGPYAPLTSAAGALTGGGWGIRAGFAATNLVLEYTNGVLDAGREAGYNMNDPEDAVRAFQDADVWAHGKERGLKRGIPIAIMDLISSGLAGRVFTGVSVASRTRKAAGFVAERFTLDPALEATGELLAQISVGDEISLKEIIAEAGGAIGSKTTMAAYNIYRATRGGYNQRIAAELMDVKLMAADRASDSQVQTWANNMLKLERITPEQNQRILENLGVRKEANDLLGVAGPSRVGIGSRQRGRVMELLSIRDGLEETSTRRSVFSKEISRINNELSEISRTGKLSESPIDLKTFNTIGGTRTQAPSYRIGSVLYSKSEFLKYIENLTPRRVARIVKNSEVTNDEETSILLDEKLKPFDTSVSEQTTDNAIQEPSTTEVDVQQPTTDSEEVGTGDVVEETAETAEAQDEVAPTPEQPEVLEVSDRATRKDVDAFRNETIAPERKSALLAGVAKRQNDGKKLTKFQQEMADANAFEIAELQPKLLEQDAVALEAADLEAAIAADEVSKPQAKEEGKPKPPEFRIEGESLGVSQDETDAETMAVLEAMNESAALTQAAQAEESAVLKARLEASENKTGPKLDAAKRLKISQRIDELKQEGKARETEGKATKIDVAELNSRLDNPLPVVSWKVVEGVPMIFNISDQLRTGDIVNPLTGTLIDNLKGGLGFTGVEGHQDMAWASVTIDKAQGQIDSATKVYNDNTEIFERWWKANPEYKGLVPMAIVKMGQSSIMSNEAVVRVLADNLTSFSKTKRTAAMSAFKRAAKQEAKAKEKAIKTGKNEKGEKLSKLTLNAYRSRIADIADVMAMIGETNPKTIDDILTPDALSVLKGITSVNVITDLIMSGNPNTVGEAKKTPGKAKKAVPAALLGENPSKEDRAKLNAGVVTDLITEPQLEGVPQRSVFIIQGVDVLNPGVLSTNHPNYPVGPRGKTIGILEQPQSVIDLFPAVANNVQLGISKENRGGKRRTERSRLTQVIPVQAGLPNTEFVGSIAGINQRASVLDFLNRAFPSVNVSVDTETFNNVMASEGVKEYLKGDDVIYGVTKDGDIYLNPDVHSSESALYNTAIHEFGHIWTDYLQTTPKGKKVYAKGVELVSKTDEYQNQLKKFRGTTDENGNTLTEEQVKKRAVNEAMAILIGNKGETIVNASLKQQFQEWLNAAWTYIKETFKMSADLKVVEIQALTLDEFLGTALADIMSGKAIKMTEVQVKKLKNPEAAFSMSDSMTDIISRGRAEGFSEASIRQVLLARGYSSANVKASMAVNMDLFSESVVPFEFGNIEGGMAAGIRLFQSIQSKVADFAAPNERRTGVRMTAREREQRIFDLREDHPSLLPEEVSDASLLRRFPRRGQQAETVTTQKTPGEVRAKALEVLRDNDVFKAQTEAVQMELVVAIDRAIGIRANRAVSKEITAIRTNLTQRKRAVREVEAVKRQLRQFIRRSLPKSSTYSQADINKLVRSVERVNEDNYRVQVEKILQVVEKQRAKMRTAVLKKLLKDVTAGASRSVTTRKLNRAKSLSPEGRAFSVEFKRVLKLAMLSTDEEAVSKLQKLVETLETDEALEAFTKDAAGEVLTQKEHQYINLAAALDLAKNLDTMSLEEVEAMANDYKVAASQSRQYLSETRKARARKSAAIRQKITDAMRRSNPELFNENGTLKDTNEDRAVMDAVREYWNEGKGEGLSPRVKGQVKAAKLYFETYRARSIPKLLRSMVDSIKHLGTFLSAINDTVHEEIFNRLNKLDNNSLRGYFKEQDFLSSLGYETVQQGLFDTKMYKIEGLISTKNKTRYNTSFSKDQLLRFYALSLNPVQRRKLAAQGIDEEKMDGIKKHLGKEAIDFADKVVQYLSTEYYESVNDVYRDINDANLSYVENYFPTMTTQSDVNSTQLFQGDFNGIFNAESAPALRNRTDMTSDIDLKGAAFSTALESHIKTMEHYKAYAADVKALNTILNTSALDATLGKYGIRTLVKQSINNAINPDSGRNALSETGKAFNTLQTQFTAFALAFKAMQVLKQATSFINAFEQYSYRKGKKIGWTADFFIDILPFIADYTAVLINMRKYHNLFKDISPTYRYRVQQGVKGDLAALESGSPTQTGLEYATTKRAKAWRGYKRAGASPTVAGDILGVMGYAANFRRDIKNGMSEEDAVAKFNEYNATQQTRRASERSILQQNSNFLVRAFTMFGSTPILLTNNVMQASNSIWKDIAQFKAPKESDVRKLVLNLGMANAAFVAMANIGILLDGDDEERKEVLRKILLAAAGLNLLYQIPFVGATAKEIENWITGNRRPTRGGVNPFISLISKIKKAERDDRLVSGGIQVMSEIAIGAQIDPLLSLIRASRDIDEAGAAEAADILGISGSYRPESWEKDYVAPTAKEKREDAREKRKESSPSYIAREKRKEERKERIEERKKR